MSLSIVIQQQQKFGDQNIRDVVIYIGIIGVEAEVAGVKQPLALEK